MYLVFVKSSRNSKFKNIMMNIMEHTARKALEYWIHAIETKDWGPYLEILTEDYTFWLPEVGFTYKTSDLLFSNEQLIDSSFNDKRLKAYKNKPNKTSYGENHVVFEFVYNFHPYSECFQNSMAISFDIIEDKIKACREYHCVLMKF